MDIVSKKMHDLASRADGAALHALSRFFSKSLDGLYLSNCE